MRVNTKSVFLGCKYAIAQLLRQDPVHLSGHMGWIVNISSIMASIAGNDNRRFFHILFIQIPAAGNKMTIYAKYRFL